MDNQLSPAGEAVLALAQDMGVLDVLLAPMGSPSAPTRGAGAITADMARAARDQLNLDASTMAALMGVSARSVFYWERKGVLTGPARLLYTLILCGELPERFVPTKDTTGRVIPTAD